MNCLENENVCSVKKEIGSDYYRLHTIWKPNSFILSIASKDGAWRGEMSKSEIKNISEQLEMPFDEYLKQCKEALTTHNGQKGIVYAVENGGFTWKKIMDEDSGIKVKMGTVSLEPVSFVDTIQNMVTVALNCNNKLQMELNEIQSEQQKIISEKKALLNQLEELVKVKDEMETDLYKRFLLLLNTKKKKIAELESLLDNAGKKVKGNQKESKLNPYDVETDADSDSDSEIKISSKKSIVSDKSKKKSVTKSDSPTEKSPVGKKMKQSEKIAENINNQNSATNTLNSEPQNSREESISPQKSNIPSTKQELLTYFYGP